MEQGIPRRQWARWSSAALALAIAAGCTGRPASPPAPGPAAVRSWVRSQLGSDELFAAEERVDRNPTDAAARLALAEICEREGDRVGAALALAPLVGPQAEPASIERYVRLCARIGWVEEAEATLARLGVSAPVGRVDLAAGYAGRGDLRRAAEVLAELPAAPADVEECLEGALTWYQCGELERAVAWAASAVRAGGDHPAPRLLHARLLLAAGRPDAALATLAPLTRQEPPPPAVEFWRGCAEVEIAEHRAAGAERLAQVAAAEPNDPATAYQAGKALVLAGRPAQAIPLLSRAAVARHQEVLCYDWLARAYTATGRPLDAAWARGRALLLRGDFRGAQATLARAIASGLRQPLAYVDWAEAVASRGNHGAALAVLDRARAADLVSMEGSLLRGRLLVLLQRPADAIAEYEWASHRFPDRASEALGNLGMLLYGSEQYDRAAAALERAVQLQPADAHAHFYLGRTYGRQSDDPAMAERAVRHLITAARMKPDYQVPWLNAATLLQRLNLLPEAAACLRRAIGGDSSGDNPYVTLGQVLQQLGRHAERERVLAAYRPRRGNDLRRSRAEERVRATPGDPASNREMGEVLLAAGQPAEALPFLLIAAERFRQRSDWQRLADACALLGFDDLRRTALRHGR